MPLAAACVYLSGLFLLVMDRYILGAFLVLAGIASGIYAAITALRTRYKPSRSPDPRWRRFISPLLKNVSR